MPGLIDIDVHMNCQRPHILSNALNEAISRNAAPTKMIDRKRSEQHWLTVFSAPTVDAKAARTFLKNFQLWSRQVRWDGEEVAKIINGIISNPQFAPLDEMASLAEDLGRCVVTDAKGQMTSAASKIVTFVKPNQEVFIWDKYANLAVRWRSRVTAFRSYYLTDKNGHDYKGYASASRSALEKERNTPAFRSALAQFEDKMQSTQGPIANRTNISSGFLERRLFDKLLFLEGRAIEAIFSKEI